MWCINHKGHSSTTRIETSLLGHHDRDHRRITKVIPVQQGLKHIDVKDGEDFLQITKVIPVQQGLKHHKTPKLNRYRINHKGHSSTTRIETKHEANTMPEQMQITKVIPVQQGLKLIRRSTARSL